MKRANSIFFLIAFVCFYGNCDKLSGCGLSWSLPPTPLENIDPEGKLAIWSSLGDLQVSQIVTIPINIGFSPTEKYQSQLLGPGWSFPIFDSNIKQIDEATFSMLMPDGWIIPLVRSKSDANLLTGSGWAAEIKGNTIKCAANCGWSLTFENGRLKTIYPPNGAPLYVVRDNEKNFTLTSLDKEILSVKKKLNNGLEVLEVASSKGVFDWKIETRPVISNINGTNVVSSIVPTLTEAYSFSGDQRRFEFNVDSNLNPTVKTKGEIWSWNPQDGSLKGSDRWTYSSPIIEGIVCAKRTSKDGITEIVGENTEKGTFVRQLGASGITITDQFTSGKLDGKVRSVTRLLPSGQKELVEKYSYDENGNIARATLNSSKQSLQITKNGNDVTIARDALSQQELWTKKVDAKGRLTFLKLKDVEYTLEYVDNAISVTKKVGNLVETKNVPISEFNAWLPNEKLNK